MFRTLPQYPYNNSLRPISLTNAEFDRRFVLLQSCVMLSCPALTHWGRVTHIYVSKLTNIASDNGLSPGRRQAIIWTDAGILLIGPLGTNFSQILSEIHIFSFKKMHLKMSSGKWRPFCLGLNVLTVLAIISLEFGLKQKEISNEFQWRWNDR